jgi:hypothetical protein
MNVDKYTKAVLTVIAAALVWLCARPLFTPKETIAQSVSYDQGIAISGWSVKTPILVRIVKPDMIEKK